jgi:geranylgeranyl diphosphate synthase type I
VEGILRDAHSMNDFHALLEEQRAIINRRIEELLSSGFEQSEANDLVMYTFRSGGKRLRPILVLLACESVGGDSAHAIDAAVAMESIHAASLIFDDLIDKHRLRRNRPTIQYAFSYDKAVSAARLLASKGVQVLSEYEDTRIARIVGRGLVDLSRGEILDTITDLADVDHYLTVADLKTGSLFSASAGIGGILGGGTVDEVNCLFNYGRAIGIAFQIKDDILDNTGDPERQERVNLVLMRYLDEPTKKAALSNIFGDKKTAAAMRTAWLGEKAPELASRMSKDHVERAKRELKGLRGHSNHKQLEHFADYVVERTY